jgi:hypothetical protein
VAEEAMRGSGGGDEIWSLGRAGVEDHRLRRRARGMTALRTFWPRLPRMDFDVRPRSGEVDSPDDGPEGNVGRAGTELKVSLSINNDGDRGRSNDCVDNA